MRKSRALSSPFSTLSSANEEDIGRVPDDVRLTKRGIGGITAWRFAYLFIQGGLSLALFAALAHALPVGAFAITAVAQAVLVIAQAMGDFGLSPATVTVLPAMIAQQPGDRQRLLAGAVRAFALAAIAGGVLCLAAAVAVPADARLAVVLVAPAAASTVLISGADGLLRATGEFRRSVGLVAVARLGSFLAVPAAIATDSGVWTCAAISAGTLVGTVPAALALRAFRRLSRESSPKPLLRVALPLGLSQFFVLAGGRLNTVILSAILSLRAATVFEASWRLFQLGQYVAGGISTAAAPLIGDALGAERHVELHRLLARLGGVAAGLGLGAAAVLLLARRPLCEALFGSLGGEVARVVVPFALLTPLAFVGFVATTALSTSSEDRRFVVLAYGSGALVGLPLVVALAPRGGSSAAAAGCAAGLALTHTLLIARYLRMLRGLRANVGGPLKAHT
ncbi:MAG: hypothetical protein QOJ38_707 [Solirubrobacterales bacterium]|jgi:O-antigen/teichoic acid export membrane protein|nr:hypothetical protein [Solirubrobacterales bacterium]